MVFFVPGGFVPRTIEEFAQKSSPTKQSAQQERFCRRSERVCEWCECNEHFIEASKECRIASAFC